MSDGESAPGALQRLQGAIAAAGLASWDLDPGTGRLAWSEGGFEGADWRPSELFPTLEAWLDRVHPEDRPEASETLETARRGRGRWLHDHRVVLAGSEITRCRAAGQVHVDEAGAPVGMTGILQELAAEAGPDRGRSTEAAAQSLAEDRNRILLRELQHRVRNSMATVRSIARNSVTGGRSVEDYVEYFDGRIAAYARVQSAAIADPLAGLDLDLLLRDALTVLAVPDRQVRIEGPQVSLKPRVAEQLAIAFHELATNALVHGALRNGAGQIDLSWQWGEPPEEGRLSVRWVETADIPLKSEGPPGFGTAFLTRFLPYTLKAHVAGTRHPTGIEWEIVLPEPRQEENAARFQGR